MKKVDSNNIKADNYKENKVPDDGQSCIKNEVTASLFIIKIIMHCIKMSLLMGEPHLNQALL